MKKEVIIVSLPQNLEDFIWQRINPIYLHHIKKLSFKTLTEHIEKLAAECYLQGVLDGSQVTLNSTEAAGSRAPDEATT